MLCSVFSIQVPFASARPARAAVPLGSAEGGMPATFGTADYWLERAAEAHAVADQMHHDEAKR